MSYYNQSRRIPALNGAMSDRPLRILANVHKYVPEFNAGAEWMLHEMLTEMVRRGHSAHVMAWIDPRTFEGVTMGPALNDWSGYDVAITYLDTTRKAIALARYYRIPLVHIVHNHEQLGVNKVRPHESTLTVFNSEWIAKLHQRYSQDWSGELPSMVLRPPVASRRYKTNPGRCVTLINLTPKKGSALFYELAERMPQHEFLGVRGAYGPQLPAPSLSNLTIIDHTPNIREVYRRTSVLVMPSEYESYGRCAIEACASGIPVIAHPTPGLQEALSHAGVFVDRFDVASWEREIDRLIKAGPERNRVGAQCLKRSRELDQIAREDLDMFELALRRCVGP